MPRDSEVDAIDNETVLLADIVPGELISGAYREPGGTGGTVDPFIRRRDSWPVQFASFERRRRGVYCAKI